VEWVGVVPDPALRTPWRENAVLLTKEEILGLYRRRAARYDFSANLYYLLGVREQAYRRKAAKALQLEPGDTVVELGCGTGLNFPLLMRQIGPEGRLIGVDLTDRMLSQARRRIQRKGWTNVELVQSDAAKYEFPRGVNGILSSFALTLVPEFDHIIRDGAEALSPGGRWVILDFKRPERWPMWLVRLAVLITQPFGVSLELTDRHPWESVERYLMDTSLEEFYGGCVYISSGRAPAAT
jgi:demethylmenaquinone methyltransferase/2-methoxy-6-polyprenyl-1,4-benzoquinol methylase